MRRILVNDFEIGEVRVAVVEDDLLDDLFVERETQRSYLGNIYKGRVVNLEPGIQAAFVEFGGDRNGFLHASDVMPEYGEGPVGLSCWQQRPVGRPIPIQDVLKQGQDVLVQVTKEGIGKKGPTLTTYLSIPGKYMVLMPSLGRIGVSKRIHDIAKRGALKAMIRDMDPPEGMGVIVRTAAAARTAEELKKDLDYLLNLWESLTRRAESSRCPAAIYLESDLVIRTIRDIVTVEVDEIVVDSEAVYDRAAELLDQVMPDLKERLLLHEGDRPLFHAYDIEEQVERLFRHRVPLASGGSLIIEQTEALVAIDVNSGRYKREKDLEDTALRMNLEAVPEICRQLRLRDMGGLIIIDFIDMRAVENRTEVEKAVRRELRRDRARVRVAPMSEFGVIELTRQRVRPSLRQEAYVRCRRCQGTGYVKSLESMILKMLRDVRVFVRGTRAKVIRVTVPSDVALHVLNDQRSSLTEIEARFEKRIIVTGDSSLAPEEVLITAE